MINLNMLSNNFSHAHCSTWWKKPKNIKWDFGSKNNSISVYIDMDVLKGINDRFDGKKKFLWLLESKSFDGGVSNYIQNNLDKVLEVFEEIWTHNLDLLNLSPKFKWSPSYGTYINNYGIYPKTKLLSMITSDKQATEQHRFRYNFAIKNKQNLDLYGRGFKEIQNKEEGLKDYMFSIAIENDTYDTYFTEKILDCFATGTIPVYKGTRKIVEHFNSDGIIFLDDILINNLTPELYYSKINDIQDNFSRVQNLDTLDDWIYNKYLINYV